MNLVMIGPPGGGKGTYSNRISEKYDIPHIATGDIFRREMNRGSDLGEQISEYVDNGVLVPDEIVNKVIDKRLSESDCEEGFVLDGYPRTKAQAKALIDITSIDQVINLDVADEVVVNRLSSRVVCEDCGEVYNTKFLPPEGDCCDECEGELIQREDDKPEVIRKRLKDYKEKAEPLLEYYRDKGIVHDVSIPEERPIEEIMKEIYAGIKNI